MNVEATIGAPLEHDDQPRSMKLTPLWFVPRLCLVEQENTRTNEGGDGERRGCFSCHEDLALISPSVAHELIESLPPPPVGALHPLPRYMTTAYRGLRGVGRGMIVPMVFLEVGE